MFQTGSIVVRPGSLRTPPAEFIEATSARPWVGGLAQLHRSGNQIVGKQRVGDIR
jgi:hypothetical protein